MASVQVSEAPPELEKIPHRFDQTQASVLLDGVRGAAAVSVLLEHWRNIFFVDYPQIDSHRWLFAAPYAVCAVGHQAVVIFFVLSGYLISGSIFRMLGRRRWDWRIYGVQRLSRLWIVLVPGLLLTALWDWLGMHLHRPVAIALYAGSSGDHVVGNVGLNSSFTMWLGNLLFVQTVYVPVFGSDSALWSLANEFWYYALFPLGLLAIWRGVRLPMRLVYASLLAVLVWAVRPAVLLSFPVWLIGVVLVWLPPRRMSAVQRGIASALYLAVLYTSLKVWLPEPAGDWVFGVVTAGYLWTLLSAGSRAEQRSAGTRMVRRAARFSYTLYVVHTPLLALLAALILRSGRWQPDGPHLAFGVGIMVFVVGFCYLLASVTEFRTDAVRAAIERRLGWNVEWKA
jgi:peptidoglycan/LPS O-acetylase OafA/YrhL